MNLGSTMDTTILWVVGLVGDPGAGQWCSYRRALWMVLLDFDFAALHMNLFRQKTHS